MRVMSFSTAVSMMSSVSEVWLDVGVVLGCRGMFGVSSESSSRIVSRGVVDELRMLLGNGCSNGKLNPSPGKLGA
jgi:hypothetical protein